LRRGVDTPLFLWYDGHICNLNMDREKLKLIVKNLKSLVNALESEVYSNVDAYKYVHPWDEHVSKTNARVMTSENDDDGYAD